MEVAGVLHELGLLHHRLRPRGAARARDGRGAPVPPLGVRHDAPAQARHGLQPHPRVRLWPRFPRRRRLACMSALLLGYQTYNQDVKNQQPRRANGPGRSIRSHSPRACGGVKLACAFPILAAACRRCSYYLLSVWRAERGQRAPACLIESSAGVGTHVVVLLCIRVGECRRCLLCTDIRGSTS